MLSTGERFRADLARPVCEAPAHAVVDEFTSVVDRQIARFGALAFQKAWRRTSGKVVLRTPHYDVLDWLEPDWVYDTAQAAFRRRKSLWRRPRIKLEIVRTDWRYWPAFEPHHYLKLPRMAAAVCYVGCVGGERNLTTLFHTSHPGLAAALRRDSAWQQVSARLYGDNKVRSQRSIRKTGSGIVGGGYGGHFRAVQGFRYAGVG